MTKRAPKAPKLPDPPEGLSLLAGEFWRVTVAEYEFEPHHLRLLDGAAKAWDRAEAAHAEVEAAGMTFVDRFGQPRAHPAVDIERHYRTLFASLMRELGLDRAPAGESRPPTIPANHRLRVS
ncbi:MAG TPA: P27 family phage terminase small subunit [Longimicrobiales bacterium]|nr:P27 family phage terminase small subunit [Longimicrobiales bacterium]